MIIKSEKYKKEGLIREAVKCGFGDLSVIIENEEIKTFKYILCVCNETFRKLLCDPLFEEPLRLCDECSKESFFLLEKYYQGIEIEINEENCVDLLSLCVCYNEESLLKSVSDYIVNNLNEYIAVGLLNIREMLLNENVKELKDIFDFLMKYQNYRIVVKELFNYLSVDSIEYSFSMGIKFNGNENDLLKLLLDYYQWNINDKRDKDEMRKLIQKCNFKNDTWDELNEDYNNVINEIKISKDENENEKEKYSIQYNLIPQIQNEFFYDFLMYYYPSEDIQTISFKKEDLSLLEKEDISNDIDVLLNSNEIKWQLYVLQLYDSLCLKFDILNHLNFLDIFLDYYKKMDDVNKQNIILKRIVKFISEENNEIVFERMKEKSGIEFLFNLLKEENLLDEKVNKMLMNYFHKFRLNDEECKILNSTIEDETTKRMIIYHKLGEIFYNNNYNEFVVGEKLLVVPHIYNIIDVEEITIQPDLPSGLSIDSKTGVISGIRNEEYGVKCYTITAKNVWNEKWASTQIAVYDNYVKMNSIRKKITIRKGNYQGGYCIVDVKLEKGVYHIIFKIDANGFRIGADKYGANTRMDRSKKNDMQFYYSDGFNVYAINGKVKDKIKPIEVNNNEYEVIYDMNNRTFNIKDKDGVIHLLVSGFEGDLAPSVSIADGSSTLVNGWVE